MTSFRHFASAYNHRLAMIAAQSIVVTYYCIGFTSSTEASPGQLLYQINPPFAQAGGSFGMTLAVAQGNLLIGEPRRFDLHTGAMGQAYLYSGITGQLVTTFVNPEPQSGDVFGEALAVGDGAVFVTALGRDDRVYSFSPTTGNVLARINNPESRSYNFGKAIAYANSELMISAPSYFHSSDAQNAGRSYAFNSISGQLARSYDNPEPNNNDLFGQSIAANASKVAIGALLDDLPDDPRPGGSNPGRVWIFDIETSLPAFVLENPNPASDYLDYFGLSVAIDETLILVGAHEDETFGEGTGAAYAFSSQTGELIHALTSPSVDYGGEFGQYFGQSVSLTPAGDILVGAWGASVDGFESAGRVFLFDGDTGDLLLDIPNPNPSLAKGFGWSVTAIDGKIVVGAPFTTGTFPEAGAVFVFDGYPIPEPRSLHFAAMALALLAIGHHFRKPTHPFGIGL